MAGQEKSLETARHQVPLEEVVVDFAHITCTCAQIPPNEVPVEKRSARLFHVGSGHGVFENGHHCAHDQNCAPITNVPNFGNCHSEQYLSALQAMIEQYQLPGSGITAQENAENVSARDEAAGAYRGDYMNGKCLLRLLDRWFDADEHSVMSNYYDLTNPFIMETTELYRKVRNWFRASVYVDSQKMKDVLAEAKEKICGWEPEISNIHNKLVLGEGDFTEVNRDIANFCKELEEGKKKISEYQATIKGSHNLSECQKLTERFDLLQARFEKGKSEFDGLKPKEYHLIKMNSFLVCKLGGILEFQTSGQERMENFQSLYQTLLNALNVLKNYITAAAAPIAPDSTEMDAIWSMNSNEPEKAIKKVADRTKAKEKAYSDAVGEIGKFIVFAEGTKAANEAKKSYFEIRFISHRVTEQQGKMLAFAAILSAIPGASGVLASAQIILSTALVAVDIAGFAENEHKSEIVGDITSVTAIGESSAVGILNTAPVFTNINLATALAINLPKLFYTSLDDWIEFMEIKMQIDNELFTLSQKLDQSGKAVGKPTCTAPAGEEKLRQWSYVATKGSANIKMQKNINEEEKKLEFSGKKSAEEVVVPQSDFCPNSCQH